MQRSDEYRTWWLVGALSVALLVFDFFSLLGSGWLLNDHLAYFFLGLLTAVLLAATLVLRPRKAP